ncbi:MAG TPA: hypothetical protein VHP14_04285, partial [Anaerolineales bacterium]|nr:hypothetical protein [Anaerolineales bacterium]
MKSTIKEAHQAMLEGNRDEVLRLLQGAPSRDEVVWLRAQALVSEDERNEILDDLIEKQDGRISTLASKILEREKDYAQKLNEPPDYQFWKQPTWKGRLNKMRSYGIWLFGGFLLFILTVLGISLNVKVQTEQADTIATIKTTQTAAAFYNQTIATYPAGTLQIIQIEYP